MNSPPEEKVIVSCPKCGQRIRLPKKPDRRLEVKCPCGERFEHLEQSKLQKNLDGAYRRFMALSYVVVGLPAEKAERESAEALRREGDAMFKRYENSAPATDPQKAK